MKLFTEEQMKRAIRFGFESKSLKDEGIEFINAENHLDAKPIGSRYDHRDGKDIIVYEATKKET
jgi:hypothetical protein